MLLLGEGGFRSSLKVFASLSFSNYWFVTLAFPLQVPSPKRKLFFTKRVKICLCSALGFGRKKDRGELYIFVTVPKMSFSGN